MQDSIVLSLSALVLLNIVISEYTWLEKLRMLQLGKFRSAWAQDLLVSCIIETQRKTLVESFHQQYGYINILFNYSWPIYNV